MRSGFLKSILVLVLALLAVPTMVQARAVHYFPCEDCHRAGADPLSVTTNLCLDCHNTTSGPKMLNDSTMASATGRFQPGDASNAFGNNPAPGLQTSHNWGAPDTNPAAGAKAPSERYFYGRQGFSTGRVACSRCHDPHGDNVQNPQLLKLPPSRGYTAEDMCLDCHADWNISTHGQESHPLNVDLAAAAANDPTKYNATPDNSGGNGNVTLINGKVSCSSCHGVHWVDSDASTSDVQGSVGAGDGKLLKHNGAANETLTSSICTTCHKYTGHAPTSQQLGCLVCHSGHNYDPNGNPNIYLLRKQVTVDTSAIKAGGSVNDTVTLNYTAYPPLPNYDNGGGNGSLCLSCHDLPVGHDPAALCADCHAHDNPQGSFGAGCGSCHGYAPSVNAPGNTTQGGYAKSTQTSNDYSTSGVFKDESQTPHAAHANGGTGYSFGCQNCHGDGSGQLGSADHDAGSFQQVLDKGVGSLPALTTNNGALTPTYNTGGSGTCNAVYCHSNGAPRGGTTQTVSVTWAGQAGSIIGQPGECQQCHGNDAASMGTKGNSATHSAHLSRFSCNVCHKETAASATALAAGATTGAHVNGAKDVVFDDTYNLGAATLGTGSYTSAPGTCAVYCHSNGKGANATPDWDVAGSGACGTCHQVNASGDSGAALSGAHAKHVFDANGPQLNCSDCHGAGADTGSHSGHINGGIDAPAQSTCNSCHGATAGGSGYDAEPVWTDANSVSCETCHLGTLAVVKGKTAPAKDAFVATGHGSVANFNTAHPESCEACHDTNGGKHFDATSGDLQLTGGASANDAFCQSCHPTKTVHYANSATAGGTSTDANSCAYCHEPHGEGVGAGFDAMVLTSVGPTGNKAPTAVTGFTDRTSKTSYQNGGFSGICQVCHDPNDGTGGAINHYNRALDETAHNGASPCIACHNHDATTAFQPGAGTACNDCHGTATSNAPNTGAHLAHTTFQTSDKDNAAFDATECDVCHTDVYSGPGDGTGTLQYTYDPIADQGRGLNHSSASGRDSQLTAAVGWDPVAKTCSNACHQGPSGKTANWYTASSLGCDACHYYSATPTSAGNVGVTALTGTHNKHFDANAVCTDCHADNTGDTVSKRTHITTDSGVKDAVAIKGRAQALQDEAAIDATVGIDPDPGNPTCSNVACHNPSNDGHSATWTVSTASCLLCHNGDVASGSPMASGSHTSHVNNAAEIGDNIACVTCHGDTTAGGTDTAHRNGTVDMLPTMVWNQAPNLNSCNTLVCHNDSGGKVGPPSKAVTPTWGTTGSDCNICHTAPSSAGDHANHWDPARQAKGLTCATCHADTVASNSTIKAGGKHLNDVRTDFVPSGNYDGSAVTVTYDSGTNPSTCTASCHTTGNPKFWQNPSTCEACHGDLSYVGGAHAAHIDLTGGIEADTSECAICHGAGVSSYTYTAGGNHQNGSVDFAPGISNTTCASACHASDGTDGYWTDTALNCTACHNANGSNDGVMANAAPGASHVDHLGAGMACSDCHGTVDAVGTSPLTHNHSKDNTSDATRLQTRGKDFINPSGLDVNVDDAAWNAGGGSTWFNSTVTNDGGNTCSNVQCHDPSDDGRVADWDTDTANCAFCHGDDGTVAVMTTGSHQRHLEATAKFGLTINCDRCHPNNVSNAHFIKSTGPTTVNGQVQFGGSVITGTGTGNGQYSGDVGLPNNAAAPASRFGTCGTSACHNNGQGGPPVTTYTWGTAVATDCQTCHTDPPATGRHATHLGNANAYGPYDGVQTWACGDCHQANSAATEGALDMAGQPTHINGVINFNDGTSTNAGGINTDSGAGRVTVCDNCHGGATDADTAKTQWDTIARLACESCHDGTPANSKADGSGVTAPDRASNFANGHGGAPAQTCTDCHDNSTDHITGTLGDSNRLKVLSSKNYDTITQRNAWCNDCHATSMNGHYDTGGGTPPGNSDSGLYCNYCHNPHGDAAGQDAMISSTIQGKAVSGFSDRSVRASYANSSNNGVCQVCHDPASVDHFNTATNETTHNSGVCTDCHKHTDTPAFKPSGCNGCHGGGTTGAVASNYWPDGSNANPENTAGRHVKHMEQLSLRQYGQTLSQLLDDPASDSKQKALCAFCHTSPGADADHGNPANLPAEVNSMAQLWDGAADNASYNAGTDTCSSVNCHNGKTTTDGTYGWYDAGTSTCTMCHTPGGAGANPTTGLHVVTAGGVTAHDDTLGTGCTECHNAMPAQGNGAGNTHMNGIFVADSGVNDDRGITASGNITAFNQAAVGASDSCAASCHSDSGNWQRLWSTDADSTATTLGSARCDVCHGQLGNWRAGMSVDHNLPKINDGTHTDCTQCHVAPDAPYDFATMHEDGSIQVNNNPAMSYNATAGTCSVTTCHGSSQPTRGPGASTIFPEDLLNGPGASCNSCHLATGGSANNNTIGSYTFHNRTGAHAKHVSSAATSYGSTAISTQSGSYNYGCGVCHPTDEGTYHQNGTLDVLLDPTTAPATIKALNGAGASYSGGVCSAVYCHGDGETPGSSPNFLTGSFTNPNGDYCQNCHGNQPTTGSHGKHVVGIHYDDIYSGTSGLISDAGATGAGHGDVATAITITCALCHNGTVKQWYNGNNTACVGCHGSGGSATDKTVITSADLDKTLHVNGAKDVDFAPTDPLRSKAQVRDFTATEPELDNNWQRVNGYKAGATSHDATKVSPPLNTATMWNGATKNCTVACHNGNVATWGTTGMSCNGCHTQLPK